jgi:hypothetical protein
MKTLAAILLLVAVILVLRRRQPEPQRHVPFYDDWDDPAMDVYDDIQPPDPHLEELIRGRLRTYATGPAYSDGTLIWYNGWPPATVSPN